MKIADDSLIVRVRAQHVKSQNPPSSIRKVYKTRKLDFTVPSALRPVMTEIQILVAYVDYVMFIIDRSPCKSKEV